MSTDKEQVEAIDQMLDKVLEFGMEAEVIFWSLKYMKEHPEVSPVEAFALGVTEWVK